MKDLTREDQKHINRILIARPKLTKLKIYSVSWEEGDGKRLSVAMAKKQFLGPKSSSLAKKQKVLKALGASGHVKNIRIQYSRKTQIIKRCQIPFKEWRDTSYSCFPRRTLEIGLFYSMSNLLLEKEFSPLLHSINLVKSIMKIK